MKISPWRALLERLLPEGKRKASSVPAPESKVDLEVDELREAKAAKLEKVRPLLQSQPIRETTDGSLDFLSSALRERFKVTETDNVSAHGYDRHARALIQKHSNGLVLDCGSGKRSVYLDNVVNYEIVPYATTDVLGVAEELPFIDESFDAILCLNVLEHVKDPFRCASEISRVLKKNGTLYCVTPLLQPVHGYPNHYYNMTAEGLRNLFCDDLEIIRQFVYKSGKPIHALSWFLNSWINGLPQDVRPEFLQMTVEDLVNDPYSLLGEKFSSELSESKNFELACTTSLIAKKK